MNGFHDMGGMDNFGSVVDEANEPVFHEDWERSMFALFIALIPAGYCNMDEIRRIVELIPPATYLDTRYYEKWLYAIEMIALEKDILTLDEIENGQSSRTEGSNIRPAVPAELFELAAKQRSKSKIDLESKPGFKPGDIIVSRNMHPSHHTRIPRYARNKRGVVVEDNGIFLLPDTRAHDGPDIPEHVYTVRFTAQELWGVDAPIKDSVCLDLFESYLQTK
ncbi:MAG: nitrile hydratase subunit beta [Gammaproteobacteria bacterium]|nr:nitrile hydratase subunit beta [Gammaproteobacteria bacterium]